MLVAIGTAGSTGDYIERLVPPQLSSLRQTHESVPGGPQVAVVVERGGRPKTIR
ncbi:hypothetical protein [Actinomadura sp. KC06]|uniref:hypothetical protein n=1 Tax=Actinomadura sp. KC06 TaxID=2530369 RepID=UPI0014055B96|nr:hypothetical protein [Actinomadura sp. KC06]